MLEPLLQLRGEWRQAAAISVPASAGEIAELLDKAIDVLDANTQLDEESLVMAADMICKAVPARPDVIAILRMRLVRAAHDFSMVTAVDDDAGRDGGGGAAFESEEALAAALFAGVGADEEEAEPARQTLSSKHRIDSRQLQQSLTTRIRWWRRRWFTIVRSVVFLGAAAGGLLYLYVNPPALITAVVRNGQDGPPQAPASAGGTPGPTVDPNSRTGTFSPGRAACEAGGEASPSGTSCAWPLQIKAAGTFVVQVGWDDAAPLGMSLLDGTGRTVQGPVTGQRVGSLSAAVGVGSYTLVVANTTNSPDRIHFTAQIGGR
jgi:hypothetical protein